VTAAAVWAFVVLSMLPFVTKVLAALGIGFIAFSGAQLALDAFYAEIQANFSTVPVTVLQLLTIFGADKAIAMLFAAYTTRLTLMASVGVITKLVLGRGGVSGV